MPTASEATMEMKRRLGSKRVKPDRDPYLASERACQGTFSSHPKGMAQPTLYVVKALDRSSAPPFVLLLAKRRQGHVVALAGGGYGP